MPDFQYKVLTKNQQIKEGTISALFKFNAKRELTRDGSILIQIFNPATSIFEKSVPFLGGFSLGEKIYFFRNLSMMIDSGVSAIESLEIVSDQVKDGKVKKTILKIGEDVRNGKRLSEAMRKFPKYFPEYIVENVNMGDQAGRLSETLNRISADLEKDDELRKKVFGAIAYPLVVVGVMVIVVIALMFFILPGISQLFIDLDAPVPLPTKILLDFADFIRATPFLIPAILLGFILLITIGLKFKRTRYILHYILLKVPVFGELMKDYNLVLFFRSLEALFKSGIPIVATVEIARNTTNNEVYKKALEKVEPALLHGVSFSDTIAPFPHLFSKQTRKIIMVGERAGKMEESFSRISDYYLRSVDYKTRMLTVLIEPFLMLALGIVVGLLALSIFLPIYNLVNTI